MSRMAEIDAELRESGRIADLEALAADLAWVDGQIAETEAWVAEAGEDYAAAMSRRSYLNAFTRRRRRISWQMDEVLAASALRIARAEAA